MKPEMPQLNNERIEVGSLVYVPMLITSKQGGRVMGWNPGLGETGRWDIPGTAACITPASVAHEASTIVLALFAKRMVSLVKNSPEAGA